MQRLDRSQKDKVAQFQSISGTSAATAIHCLQASNWTPELALDIFFSNDFPEEPEEVSSVDEAAIARLFDKYRDKQQVANAPHTLRRCPGQLAPTRFCMALTSHRQCRMLFWRKAFSSFARILELILQTLSCSFSAGISKLLAWESSAEKNFYRCIPELPLPA